MTTERMHQHRIVQGGIVQYTLLLLLVLVGSVTTLRAQQGDEWDMNSVPVDDQALPYIGVGGGYLGMAVFMNYDELNKISSGLDVGEFKGPLFLHGGGGFTALYLISQLRLGVYGLGGSKELSAKVTVDTISYERTLRFSMGMTAIQVDYAVPLVGSLTMFPGFLAGFNSYGLKAIQSDSKGVGFDTLFGSKGYAGTDNNYQLNRSTDISSSSFILYPAVNFEFAVTQFILLRAGGGYSFSFPTGDWKTGNDIKVSDVPTIKAEGATLQFGIFVGLFQ